MFKFHINNIKGGYEICGIDPTDWDYLDKEVMNEEWKYVHDELLKEATLLVEKNCLFEIHLDGFFTEEFGNLIYRLRKKISKLTIIRSAVQNPKFNMNFMFENMSQLKELTLCNTNHNWFSNIFCCLKTHCKQLEVVSLVNNEDSDDPVLSMKFVYNFISDLPKLNNFDCLSFVDVLGQRNFVNKLVDLYNTRPMSYCRFIVDVPESTDCDSAEISDSYDILEKSGVVVFN